MDQLPIEDSLKFADAIERAMLRDASNPPFSAAGEDDLCPRDFQSELAAIVAASERGLVRLI